MTDIDIEIDLEAAKKAMKKLTAEEKVIRDRIRAMAATDGLYAIAWAILELQHAVQDGANNILMALPPLPEE